MVESKDPFFGSGGSTALTLVCRHARISPAGTLKRCRRRIFLLIFIGLISLIGLIKTRSDKSDKSDWSEAKSTLKACRIIAYGLAHRSREHIIFAL